MGTTGFCVLLTPLPEVAQGPSVKASAISQALSSSLTPLWFGAHQCLEQSRLPIHIRRRARGSRLLAKERQPMASLWLCRVLTGR